MKRFKDFLEEDGAAAGVGGGSMPANNVGTGNIAGVGVGPQGEPGVSPGVTSKKKKSPVMFKLPITRKRYNG